MTTPADHVRVTLMLCDHAAVADGKLYVAGGGWTRIKPAPTPFGIAAIVEVPWAGTDRSLAFRLRLAGEDGHDVVVADDNGQQAVQIDGQVQVARPTGVRPGTAIAVPMAFSFPGMALPAGHRLVWELSIDGQTRADWRLPFDVDETDATARRA